MNKELMILLLLFLIVCAVSVSITKNLLTSLIIYMAFSLVMSIIWICLQSPDLAITEAAVGAGVTSILFFVTLKKIHAIDESRAVDESRAADETEVRAAEEARTEDKKVAVGDGDTRSEIPVENALAKHTQTAAEASGQRQAAAAGKKESEKGRRRR